MKAPIQLISISFLLVISNIFGNTITVCDTCEISSIKQAISIADDGDDVVIEGGSYYENNIIIDKKLNVIGRDYPIVDGKNIKDKEIFIIQSDSVSITGLKIQNVGPSFVKDIAAIRVKRKKQFAITNNKIFGAMFAIYLEYSDDGLVEGNTIIGEETNVLSAGNGIHAWYCNNIKISNNIVSKQRDGIYFEFVNDSYISKNTCTDNMRYGLHFMFSNNDTYEQNIFTNNDAGVAVMFSKNIIMHHNKFIQNWGSSSYGLLLKEIYDGDIYSNIFQQNSVGIQVEGSSRILYKNNEFIKNGWAIKITGGCYDNHIISNNFISNSFDMSLKSSINSNLLNKNYWSEYSGYDLDNNGIGDVPYRPIKLFNFIVSNTPEATILMRSLFLDIINFSEKVTPIFTPENVLDKNPMMNRISG